MKNPRMPGFPVVPSTYILAGVLILILGFLRSPGPSAAALMTVAAGVPAFFIFARRYKKNLGRKS